MADPNPNPSLLSQQQIIQAAFDQSTERLRVDAEVTAVIGEVEVIITDDNDSIKLGDGNGVFVTVTSVGPKNGLDVNVIDTVGITNAALTSLDAKTNDDYGSSSGALRIASQIGNSTGQASFNAGITDAQTLRVVLPTDQTSIPVVQSGTWNIDNITGTVSLPTGAATSALQTTGNTSLSSIDSKLNTLGQKAMAASVPVVIASNQSAVPASQSGNWNINDITGIVSLPTGAATEASLVKLPLTQASTTAGQSGVLSQGAVTTAAPTYTTGQTDPLSLTTAGRLRIDGSGTTQPISAASLPLPTGASTSALQTTGNTSLASIDSKLTAPLSVTQTQAPSAWYANGYVATASTATALVMASSFSYQALNDSIVVQSNSANDTLAGTGAQKITITYFLQDGSGPLSLTSNMQGTTIFIAGISPAFIQSVVVSQVGSGGTNAGIILISGLSPLATMATINVGESETYYAHHFVPLGKTAYITDFSYSGTSTTVGRSAEFILKKQSIPLASNAKLATIGRQRLIGTASSSKLNFCIPVKVIGPALIFAQVTPDSATADTWYASLGGYEI